MDYNTYKKTLEDINVLKGIEFATISSLNPGDDQERVTIISDSLTLKAIKIAIAKEQIFQGFYSRLILQENPDAKLGELVIVPDHLIDSMVDKELKNYINNDKDFKNKLQELNRELENIDEKVLTKIAFEDESNLTGEELSIKKRIQETMIDTGKNLDNLMSNNSDPFSKVLKNSTIVDLNKYKEVKNND